MAITSTREIQPSKVMYIKLGEGGEWEKECIAADDRVLWITFYERLLGCCFSEPVITLMPDKTKTGPVVGRMEVRGHRRNDP